MKLRKKNVQVNLLVNGKKALTSAVVNEAFRSQKTSLAEYLAELIKVGVIVAFAYFLNPVCFLFLIPFPFYIMGKIRKDIRRYKKEYYMIERPCIDKKIAEDDESPDEWQLWFYNREGDWIVAASVDKEYYDATEIGEEFYLVFAKDERTPCLWYRKSEWELIGNYMK